MLWSVEDRTRDTIQPKIQQVIMQGSTIYSDSARIYDNLGQIGYTHESVNHTEEFVRPGAIHTNTMEGFWGNSKAKFKTMRGVHPNQLNAHLDEMVYRHNRSIDAAARQMTIFSLFLRDVKEQYDCTVYDRTPPGYNAMPPRRY